MKIRMKERRGGMKAGEVYEIDTRNGEALVAQGAAARVDTGNTAPPAPTGDTAPPPPAGNTIDPVFTTDHNEDDDDPWVS